MVPKLHKKGTSFKGAAAYLLHDPDKAKTDERVAWTATRNLALKDPDKAWRIMAATAMDQDRLKAEAGVKNTGRKSAQHVLHLSLSWHPEETPSRPQMIDTANGALAALGAQDHQAMIIAHNDEPHPHVHILINRVSPIDGRHLSSSKEKYNLSRWAEAYERENGKIYCENRVENNAERDRDAKRIKDPKNRIAVRYPKDPPRHIFEALRGANANDNSRNRLLIREQRKKDHALAKEGRLIEAAQRKAWQALEDQYARNRASLDRDMARLKREAKREVRELHKRESIALRQHQALERDVAAQLERHLFGRVRNTVDAWRVLSRLPDENRQNVIRRAFEATTREAVRLQIRQDHHAQQRALIERQKASDYRSRLRDLQTTKTQKLTAIRDQYTIGREQLITREALERDRLQARWKHRAEERQHAFAQLAPPTPLRDRPSRVREPGNAPREPFSVEKHFAEAKSRRVDREPSNDRGDRGGGRSR